jgi:hypothetical protein
MNIHKQSYLGPAHLEVFVYILKNKLFKFSTQ